MKKIVSLLFATLFLALTSCGRTTPIKRNTLNINSYDKVTLYDLGAPTLVAGTSYYSNGTLVYTNSGSTVGYNLTNNDVLIDLDLTFTGAFEFPSWFSITFRASGFDRTFNCGGYTYLVRPTGYVETWKNGAVLAGASGTFTDGFVVSETNNVVCGAVEENDGIHLIFMANDTTIIDFVDDDNPLTSSGSYLNFCADNVVSATIGSNNVPVAPVIPDFNKSDYELASFVDFGSPLIAGTATYEEGLINYAHSGCTVGYNLKDNNVLLDFYLSFYGTFVEPSWLSLSLRASGFDRTHAVSLDNRGYIIMIHPSGVVSLNKDWTPVHEETFAAGFAINEKYDIQVGAVDYEDGVRVVLYVNDELVLDYYDFDNPLLASGNWFNICSDAGYDTVSAYLEAKKESFVPEYPTYTFSTLRGYPTLAGYNQALVDKHNNVTITEGGQTVGFYEALQNFSLAGSYYFYEIGEYCNFWMALRVMEYNRASYSATGYSFRIGQTGIVEIYKNGGTGVIAGGGYYFAPQHEYYIEFGAVDYSPTKTRVFISINNQIVAEAFDEDNPWQNVGWVLFNADGLFTAHMGSSIKTALPLKHKVIDNAAVVNYEIYFNSAFDMFDYQYEDFSERVLQSITIGQYNVMELNSLYHGKKNEENIRAVDVYTTANRLIISVQKDLYNSLDESVNFHYSSVAVHKTGSTKGFVTPLGYILKNTYTINVD